MILGRTVPVDYLFLTGTLRITHAQLLGIRFYSGFPETASMHKKGASFVAIL